MDGATLDTEPEATGRIVEPTEATYPVGVTARRHRGQHLPRRRCGLVRRHLQRAAESFQGTITFKITMVASGGKAVNLVGHESTDGANFSFDHGTCEAPPR